MRHHTVKLEDVGNFHLVEQVLASGTSRDYTNKKLTLVVDLQSMEKWFWVSDEVDRASFDNLEEAVNEYNKW